MNTVEHPSFPRPPGSTKIWRYKDSALWSKSTILEAGGRARNSVVFKVVQSLRHAERRRLVTMVEKRKGICVWSAAGGLMLRVANSRSRSR
jgi:hypothetical protein